MALIAPSFVALPISIALSRIKMLDKPGKQLLVYLFLNGVTGLIVTSLGYLKVPNLGFYHFASVFIASSVFLFFRSIIAQAHIKKIISLIIFVYPVLEILNTLYLQPLTQFNSYTLSLQCIVVIVLSFVYFYHKEQDLNAKWSDNGINWMVAGLLLYFSSAFFTFNFSNYISLLLRSQNLLMWNIHGVVTILLYLFIAKGYSKYTRTMENLALLISLSILTVIIIVSGLIFLQISNQNKMLKKQKEIAAAEVEHQKTLLKTEITSQEAERKRIGEDLHDEVGATLSSLRLLIEKNSIDHADEDSNLFSSKSKDIIDRVVVKLRSISHNLSPQLVGKFGLIDTLHQLCDDVNASGKIKALINFKEDDMPDEMDSITSVAVYRIITELINNSIKHANASSILVEVTRLTNELSFLYSDDGSGIDFSKPEVAKGLGLRSIESRLNLIGATWSIDKNKMDGFKMQFLIPLGQLVNA